MDNRQPPTRMDRALERVAIYVFELLPIAAVFACIYFYVEDNPTKAIFWLLVSVIVVRWTRQTLARARRLQSRPWHCEYCRQLTTVPHKRCQELKGPRPPLKTE